MTKTQRKRLRAIRRNKEQNLNDNYLTCGNVNDSYHKEMRARKHERSKVGKRLPVEMLNRKTVRKHVAQDAYRKRKGTGNSKVQHYCPIVKEAS